MDLALNDLQRLICHKTQPTILKIYFIYSNVRKQIINVLNLISTHSNQDDDPIEVKLRKISSDSVGIRI